ncbi:MAG: hypothetical protein SCALA702_04000 [Melioribacteraceae bacterium]|nr:MAG: hypothetical protein SCALA702_04000 [Melioribacteraceae bacterium]
MKNLRLLFLLSLILISCNDEVIVNNDYYLQVPESASEPHIGDHIEDISVAKWFNNHTAAITLTYDASIGNISRTMLAVDAVIERDMIMDLEMVTAKYSEPENAHYLDFIRDEMIPKGIGFFGHGHEHINHDELGYKDAYNSFSLCYELMSNWGLNPVTYAYPHARGYKGTTQLAVKRAGFIAARGYTLDEDEFLICPNEKTEPENWFYLPCVGMAKEYEYWVQSNTELTPHLQRAVDNTAWIMLMYHSVGMPEVSGYYDLDEFETDLETIKSMDFWCDHMDNITLYIYEKNSFYYLTEYMGVSGDKTRYRITFGDGFAEEIYSQPLTINLSFKDDYKFSTLEMNPSAESGRLYSIENNKVSINVIPDETTYDIFLY